MLDFKLFKQAVALQFAAMCQYPLYRVDVDKDLLWDVYLHSFPEGSNPIFRERREYDCSCCRQFVRSVGDVVAIADSTVVSIWDLQVKEPAYQAVADVLAAVVGNRTIANVFLSEEASAGTECSFEAITGVVGSERVWNHFHVNIPREYVLAKDNIGPKLSDTRSTHDVFARSLEELTVDAVDTVLELIAQNSLYRGEENKTLLQMFRGFKKDYEDLRTGGATALRRDAYVWEKMKLAPAAVARVRNTAIGTLLVDLSSGVDLEEAVRKFEAVVAPANYRRPTSLVTDKMVASARTRLEELGLVSALERRYARLDDININNVLFMDRGTAKPVVDDVFTGIPTKSVHSKNLDKVEEIPVEKFIHEVLPRAQSVELLVENRHAGNFVSLITAADPTSNNLFKWDNKFSWSYAGELTDSVRERVKQAGGNVTGEILCRLAWYNHDDLDLHMEEPRGYEIYFGNKRVLSPAGGKLDVDMNAGAGTTRTPVENIFYARRATMHEGVYKLHVHNFCKRESDNAGFEVEFEHPGGNLTFAYEKTVRDSERVNVLTFRYTEKNGIEVISSLPATSRAKTMWMLPTQQFHRVNLVMFSPNHWDTGVGNKHYFFMLEGCINDGNARGFYNEFLREFLNVHRKVIEMVGARTRVPDSAYQLSGLGFSSTQRADVLARVRGAFTRTVKIVF